MEEVMRIEKYLDEKGIYPEYVSRDIDDKDMLHVQINWGDWKHDHLYCRYLMTNLGYEFCGETVTEENGSDTYSARHYYKMVKLKEEDE
jgi:hypothetical protein